MIIFKKTRDLHNQFDHTDITVESDAVTVPEILEDFKGFLMACGYPINFMDELVVEKPNIEESGDD